MLHCLWGRGQRGTSEAHLLVSNVLSNELSCESGSFSHCGNPLHSPQSALSLHPPFSQPHPRGPLPCQGFSPSAHLPCLSHLPCLPLTSLVDLVDCFFNSLVVGVPCSLIFWHFWLLIVFRLVVILLVVVRGSEGFVPMPPSWPELLENIFKYKYSMSKPTEYFY